MIYIDRDRCTGCGRCVEVCPADVIRIVAGKAMGSPDECRECEACMDVCPEGAIMSVREPVSEDQAVAVRPRTAQPQVHVDAQTVTARGSARLLPWLGAAAAFVGREVVPRVLDVLLDAWDGRVEQQAASTLDTVLPDGPSRTTMRPVRTGRGGHRHGWRRHGRG